MSKILSVIDNFNSSSIIDMSLLTKHVYFLNDYCIYNYKYPFKKLKSQSLLQIMSYTFSCNSTIISKVIYRSNCIYTKKYIFILPYIYENIFNLSNMILCLWTSVFNGSVAPEIHMGLINDNYFAALDTNYKKENYIQDKQLFYFDSQLCLQIEKQIFNFISSQVLLSELK